MKSRKKKIGIFMFKNRKANVYFLQETFSSPMDEKVWSTKWGGQIFYPLELDHSKGMRINSRLHAEIARNSGMGDL